MKNKKTIGYARVSTKQQDLSLQIEALKNAGISENNIYVEFISGSLMRSERPIFDECIKTLNTGDTLVVWRFDRIGRSMPDLVSIIHELRDKEVIFVSLTEKVDTSSPLGLFFFEIIASFAQFEKNIIKERTKAGLEAARKRGVVGGRKNIFSSAQEKLLVDMYKYGTLIKDISKHFGVSKTCIYRYLNKNGAVKKMRKNDCNVNL
jgi:DNA invertase Pin-like site-specific DNA recombinase